MGLKDLVAAANAATTPVMQPQIAPHYAEYLATPEQIRPGAAGSSIPWSDKALQFRTDVEAGAFKRERSGRISPSSITVCERRVMFGYLGAPQAPRQDLELENMAGFGNMRHLYHQMVGMTLGYLQAGEVWTHHPSLNFGGSMDGVGEHCGIFELKSVASTKYQRIVQQEREILFEHRMQLAAYSLASGIEHGSVLYEDRNYGNFYEFRWQRNDEDEDKVLAILHGLKHYIDLEQLPDMLTDCERKVGMVFKDCAYAGHCHAVAALTRG